MTAAFNEQDVQNTVLGGFDIQLVRLVISRALHKIKTS